MLGIDNLKDQIRASALCAATATALAFAFQAIATLPFDHYGGEGTVLFPSGFHFVSGHLYNTATTTPPARLAGIEYIITTAAFETLDYEGKETIYVKRQLWHGHIYEITSGSLIEPNMPSSVDHTIMRDVLHNSTYPIGIPELMMGYTGDDQITPSFATQRDGLFGVNTTEIRESLSDKAAPEMVNGAFPRLISSLTP
ncbi:hypothetical protein F5X96DRAFT_692409 [Biscogniauxia mediterranea]|nr:hypothetical protein F5X96DRAFT_692409 [Biscogniauxia mediterranea]